MLKGPLWRKVALYYLVAYLLTGIFFALQAFTGISGEVIQLAQMGPALAAMIFVALEGNRVGMFLRNGLRMTLDRFSVLMIVVTIILTLAVSILTANWWGVENINSSMSLALAFSTVLAALCEEIGWRGYLLPLLQSRMTPVKASILLGVLWAFWHVPKLLMGLRYFAMWSVGIIGLTLVLTHTFNRSNGNLTAVTLIHSTVNIAVSYLLLGSATDYRVILLFSIGYLVWAAALIIFDKTTSMAKATPPTGV